MTEPQTSENDRIDSQQEAIEQLLQMAPEAMPEYVANLTKERSDDELADIFEGLPIKEREQAWHCVPLERQVDVLVEMGDQVKESIIEVLTPAEQISLIDTVDAEELVELSETLSDDTIDAALKSMDEEQRQYYQESQLYREDEIGHWVDHDIIIMAHTMRVRDALRLIRKSEFEHVEGIYIVDRIGNYSGMVRVRTLLNSQEHEILSELQQDIEPLLAVEDVDVCIEKVLRTDLYALPVVNRPGKLIGRFDTTDAARFYKEQLDARVLTAAGLDDEADLFEPVIKSSKTRAFWLGLNLLTAFMSSWFIGLFEATLQEVVALAVLMPIVASMGGIAGSQTLTLLIRGMALNQVTPSNFKVFFTKEMKVSLINGVLWSTVIFALTYFWFGSIALAGVILLAIIINIVCAAFFGVIIPVVLDKFNLDPALSGSVLLTTFTDIIGFVAFLGFGTLFLL